MANHTQQDEAFAQFVEFQLAQLVTAEWMAAQLVQQTANRARKARHMAYRAGIRTPKARPTQAELRQRRNAELFGWGAV